MKVGVLVSAASKPWKEAVELLRGRFPRIDFLFGEEAVLAALPELEVLVASKLGEEQVERAAALKALFLPITGINAVAAGALARRGIRVFNVHANAESVAQNALAMILAWLGRTIEFHNDLKQTEWHGFWVGRGAEDEWDTLFERRVAILGTGAIGSALALLLKAFRCEVTGWRRRVDEPLPPGFDRIEPDLHAAVAGRDIVVAALPLTKATAGIIDARAFEAMRGAFFVNVGRGRTADEEALWLALRDKVLAGAGIDVWYSYPAAGSTKGAPSRFPLHELPNVILSPHVGGSTRQASAAAVVATRDNLAAYLAGGPVADEVDLAGEY